MRIHLVRGMFDGTHAQNR